MYIRFSLEACSETSQNSIKKLGISPNTFPNFDNSINANNTLSVKKICAQKVSEFKLSHFAKHFHNQFSTVDEFIFLICRSKPKVLKSNLSIVNLSQHKKVW